MRCALLVAVLAASAAAMEAPYLSGRVNDDAHLFDAGASSALESTLKDYEARTGRQIVVLTIRSLEGVPIEEFSLQTARTWRLGAKGRDDGVLILVARNDRQVRIEVGYGLEGALPDALCGRIIRDEMIPRFRGGDYAGGVTAGVTATISALSGAPSSPSSSPFGLRPGRLSLDFKGGMGLALFVFLMIHSAFELVFVGCTPASSFFMFLLMDLLASMYIMDWRSFRAGSLLFLTNAILLAVLKWAASNADWGRDLAKTASQKGTAMHWLSSSGSGGFSGGGGSFGGGGASGSW
jgi:uncharacterized protein